MRNEPTFKIFEKDGKYNVLDQNDNPISQIWYDKIWRLDSNFYGVRKGKKLNVMNIQGDTLCDIWFDEAETVAPYILAIKDGEKTYFFNILKRQLSDTYYDAFEKFHDGFARVFKNSKCNFVDYDFDIISPQWFFNAHTFKNGLAKVYNGLEFNLLNGRGNLTIENWVKEIGEFVNGYAIVCDTERDGNKINFVYNYVDEEGHLINKYWYDSAEDFSNGTAIVRDGNKCFYINGRGERIGPAFYDEIKEINTTCSIAIEGKESNLINKITGEIYYSWNNNKVKPESISNNFVNVGNQIICVTPNLSDFNLKRGIRNYILFNKDKKIKVRYKPIKVFNDNFILCQDGYNLILYERHNNIYTKLGSVRDIEFDNLYLYNNPEKEVFCFTSEAMVDVSDIIGGKAVAPKETDEEKLQRLKQEQEAKEEKLRKTRLEELSRLKYTLSKLKEIDKETGMFSRTDVDDILETVEDHLEIKDFYIDNGLLRHIDFTYISLKNVKLSGLNLSYTNISLDPQVVYNKDLSNCNFEGIYIGPFVDFRNVDIRGSKFGEDNDPTTLDGFNTTFQYALYDENTTYNGIPFTKLYGECELAKGRSKAS